MSIQLRNGLANQSLDMVLEDLLARFLVNVPDEDLSSIERVFFQVEEAQWFYTDFVRQISPFLPSMKMKTFAGKFLEKCPLVWKWGNPSDAIAKFGKYKSTIPVRGIALFNKDLTKILLVKGTDSNSWSFPRGKISKGESDMECALRETAEETGFNAKEYVSESALIERTIKGKSYKIYLAKNIPEDPDYQPHARYEISKIEWHDLKSLPKKIKYQSNNYFVLAAMLKPMMKWVDKMKGDIYGEELMMQTEIKLKALLGIHEPKQVNADAGRELLNMLQGMTHEQDDKPGSQANDGFFEVSVPQNVQKELSFYSNSGPQTQQTEEEIGQHYQQNSFLPPFFPYIEYGGASSTDDSANTAGKLPTGDYLDEQPNPELLRKPARVGNRDSDTNPRELLSVLSSKVKVREENEAEEKSNQIYQASNRTKAQGLLDLFQKKPENGETSSPEVLGAVQSNSTKKGDREEKKTDPRKKVTLLKRQDSPQMGDASKDDLDSSQVKPEQMNKEATQEIFNILKKPSVPENNAANATEKSAVGTKDANKNIQASASLPYLSNVHAKENLDQFENFEDFEDYENLEDPETPVQYSRMDSINMPFDIASDDIYEEHYESKGHEDKVHKSTEPISEKTTDNNSHEGKSPETRNAPKGPVKGKVRLLRPGETLNGVLGDSIGKKANAPETLYPDVETENKSPDSKSILDILKGGKGKTTSDRDAGGNDDVCKNNSTSLNNNPTETESQEKSNSYTSPLETQKSTISHTKSSNDILNVLKKKPMSESETLENKVQSPPTPVVNTLAQGRTDNDKDNDNEKSNRKVQSSSVNSLLNLLKGNRGS